MEVPDGSVSSDDVIRCTFAVQNCILWKAVTLSTILNIIAVASLCFSFLEVAGPAKSRDLI